jgi:hypothetical protein
VGFEMDTSVSPANSHSTNCAAFIKHTIIDNYEVSKLTASINTQLKTDTQKLFGFFYLYVNDDISLVTDYKGIT